MKPSFYLSRALIVSGTLVGFSALVHAQPSEDGDASAPVIPEASDLSPEEQEIAELEERIDQLQENYQTLEEAIGKAEQEKVNITSYQLELSEAMTAAPLLEEKVAEQEYLLNLLQNNFRVRSEIEEGTTLPTLTVNGRTIEGGEFKGVQGSQARIGTSTGAVAVDIRDLPAELQEQFVFPPNRVELAQSSAILASKPKVLKTKDEIKKEALAARQAASEDFYAKRADKREQALKAYEEARQKKAAANDKIAGLQSKLTALSNNRSQWTKKLERVSTAISRGSSGGVKKDLSGLQQEYSRIQATINGIDRESSALNDEIQQIIRESRQ